MRSDSNLILAVTPAQRRQAHSYGLPLAHLAYRIGGGPHLFRSSQPVAAQGGYMVIDDEGFDGRGDALPFCHEVLRECTARGFGGVFCAFRGPRFPVLGQVVSTLGELMEGRGWPLYVPEAYGRFSPRAKVLIPTALSGGSLAQRLADAVEQYGAGRVALEVERSALDFFLPSPTGQGAPLDRAELQALMEARRPSVFFSNELCAHYFTYMSRENGAHFILFDDAGSIRKKLHIARTLDIADALLPFSQVDDLLPDLLP